jgi:prepilin-type processing-associated H-X9-DG protein
MAFTLYNENNDGFYPCADDPVSNDPNNTYWLWMGRGWRQYVKPYLTETINKEQPSVLICPEDYEAKNSFDGTSYGYSMAFYHSVEQINNMNDVYDQVGAAAEKGVSQRNINVARPSNKILVGEWLSNHKKIKGTDYGWWSFDGARNFVFADGHVNFLNATEIRKANDDMPNPNLTVNGIKGIDWPN